MVASRVGKQSRRGNRPDTTTTRAHLPTTPRPSAVQFTVVYGLALLLVVIEGPWRVLSRQSGVVTLEHEFSPQDDPKPASTTPDPAAATFKTSSPVVFRISVTERPFLKPQTQDFRIFGTIVSSKNSVFDVKPIAIFY